MPLLLMRTGEEMSFVRIPELIYALYIRPLNQLNAYITVVFSVNHIGIPMTLYICQDICNRKRKYSMAISRGLKRPRL